MAKAKKAQSQDYTSTDFHALVEIAKVWLSTHEAQQQIQDAIEQSNKVTEELQHARASLAREDLDKQITI